MNNKRPAPPLIVIVGPTAVGKTAISIQLAERLDGEIVSADSRLFYRGLDIGTAKPTPQERERVPHHLIDVADPDETWSLAMFQRQAAQQISEIQQRGHLPFLVGGTGQYVRAVVEGWQVPRVRPNPQLRSALGSWADDVGADGLHQRLAAIDPQAARVIEPANLRRTIRALEVILTTGEQFSQQRVRAPSPYRVLTLGLTRPREELYQRIDGRIEGMLAAGLVEEVRGLLASGYEPDLPTMSAIGYHQISSYLKGEITLEEAVVQIKRATRVFVRRQANWFKLSDPDIQWFRVGDETVQEMRSTIETTLDDLSTPR